MHVHPHGLCKYRKGISLESLIIYKPVQGRKYYLHIMCRSQSLDVHSLVHFPSRFVLFILVFCLGALTVFAGMLFPFVVVAFRPLGGMLSVSHNL